MSGSNDAADAMREQQQQQQANIASGLGSINQAFAGFTPEFYQQRAADYTKFATPQLATQSAQMWRQLTGKLANQGLLKSGAAGRLGSQLQTQVGTQQQGIASAAQDQANQLQKSVEDQRSNLISQNSAGNDPLSTAQAALGQAASLSAPSTFAPLGNLFSTFGNMYLANQVSSGQPVSPYLYGSTGSNLLGQAVQSSSPRTIN